MPGKARAAPCETWWGLVVVAVGRRSVEGPDDRPHIPGGTNNENREVAVHARVPNRVGTRATPFRESESEPQRGKGSIGGTWS